MLLYPPVPGKPYTDVIDSPHDADDEWMDQYSEWIHDATGDVPAPRGYESWNVERAREDPDKELEHVREHISALNAAAEERAQEADKETIGIVGRVAPGKPYTDIIVSPLDAGDNWMELYWLWLRDDTGDVKPPPGYESWSVERAIEDPEKELQRIWDHVNALNEELEKEAERPGGGTVLIIEAPPRGKPYTDVISSPPGSDDAWLEEYMQWVYDDTGSLPPPDGYESWNMEKEIEQPGSELERIRKHIRSLHVKAGSAHPEWPPR